MIMMTLNSEENHTRYMMTDVLGKSENSHNSLCFVIVCLPQISEKSAICLRSINAVVYHGYPDHFPITCFEVKFGNSKFILQQELPRYHKEKIK